MSEKNGKFGLLYCAGVSDQKMSEEVSSKTLKQIFWKKAGASASLLPTEAIESVKEWIQQKQGVEMWDEEFKKPETFISKDKLLEELDAKEQKKVTASTSDNRNECLRDTRRKTLEAGTSDRAEKKKEGK